MNEPTPSVSSATRPDNVHEIVAALASDPPGVHAGAPGGVWAAAQDCLEFIAGSIQPSTRTLETGCGATTIVFAASGCQHTSIFLEAHEGEAVEQWCSRHGIATDHITFRAGSSSQTLPELQPGELDLVLVDGCHGFPFPQLDWYYAAAHLVDGGILIVDDTQLAAPYQLRKYLESDPRWERIRVGSQWVAFRRRGSGSLDEEWTSQRFYQPLALRGKAAERRARGVLGRLRKRVRGGS